MTLTSLQHPFYLPAPAFHFRASAAPRRYPGGRVIYTDTRAWGTIEKPLFHPDLGLTGRPDYLVEQDDRIIRWRSSPAGRRLHLTIRTSSRWLPTAAGAKSLRQAPSYGIIHYSGRDFAVDFTQELENALLDLLADMRRDEHRSDVERSTTTGTAVAAAASVPPVTETGLNPSFFHPPAL